MSNQCIVEPEGEDERLRRELDVANRRIRELESRIILLEMRPREMVYGPYISGGVTYGPYVSESEQK